MSFDDDERSARQSRPIDLYTIATPTAIYRLTSHVVDVPYGGATYTALTMSRSSQGVPQPASDNELTVYLPITHPLVRRYAAFGVPEREVLVTIHRLQSVSGVAMQFATGFGQSLSVDAHVAMLRVPSITADAFKIQLPVVADQRQCNHLLFGRLCAPNPGIDGPARASHQVVTTVVSQTGRTLAVASMGDHGDRWAKFGEIMLPSGESRMAIEQLGTTITLNEHFPGLQPGDPITVYAGCDHSIPACRDKFGNVVNFGGHPALNASFNPWNATGLGILQQS